MRDIFDLMTTFKLLPSECLKMVRRYCSTWDVSGYHGLIETHLFSEAELADKLAFCLKLDRVYSIHLDSQVKLMRDVVSFERARLWECFPMVSRVEAADCEVICADPTQRQRIDWLRKRIGPRTIFSVGERQDILRAVVDHYPIACQLAGEKTGEETVD